MATRLELLAPAGNAEIGIAAVDHGADAVYIGAPRFSARAEASVHLDDIARLIKYAHLYYVKVYVALNTILTDDEIPEALNIIKEVFQLGADGLIIQDVGLLELDLPPIPLIASTQMHNNTLEKIQFLEAVGFKRVIMPRELSLEEIALIRRKTHVELEAFVYGALCVGYSGQCYMSQAITGRSGNRGACTQPCRSRYTLTDESGRIILKDKFLLSLKDLNLIRFIPELVAAGVTSFKIEGRYKSIDYVKNATAAFRQAIDIFIAAHPDYCRSSSGTSRFMFSPDPERTFNRGHTEYFLSGRSEKVASMNTQKSIGKYVGTISGIGTNFFRIRQHDLQNGDGLCFFTRDDELTGFMVNRIDKDKIYPNSMEDIEIGTRLYRNHDTAFIRVMKKSSSIRSLAVEMDFTQEENSIRLTVTDEDGNTAGAYSEVRCEPARDPSMAQKQIEKQLSSTGSTPYRVTSMTIRPRQPRFLPVSVLNKIRRDALANLTRIRMENHSRLTVPFVPNSTLYPEKALDFRANVLNANARKFYNRHGIEAVQPAFETFSDAKEKVVMTARYCIRRELDLCEKHCASANDVRKSMRISDRHHTYRLVFDCRRCGMSLILEK